MHARVTDVAVPAPFQVTFAFIDGTRGTMDLSSWIEGKRGVFAALQDPSFFAQVRVDADAGTIICPNGADLDPDVLYEVAHGAEAGSRRRPAQ